MTSIVFVTNVNYNIQVKDITFTKNYIKQLIESIHKRIINELFNAAHSKIQTHQFILKIYKIIFNFKIVLKLTKDVVVSKFTTVSDSRLIFQDFLNFARQICFEVLIHCDSMNRAISINIKLAYFLLVSVLRTHFFQMSLIASFFYSFFSSLIIIFIDVTIFFILTSAAFWYSFFFSFIFMISSIFAFKEIDFVMFRFCIHFEREIIEIMFIEIFDYQIAENKNLDIYRHKNLSFQLLMKKLTKKKFWCSRIYKRSYMT